MDPLSVAASVVALSTAVHAATKVTRQLYHVARNAGKFKDDVEFFAAQVELFGSMVSSASSTIEDHLEKYKSSEILERLGPKALDHIASQAKYVLRCITGVKRKIPPHKTGIKLFIERFKWLMNAPERDEIFLYMERIKSSLLFIATYLCLEALNHKVHSPNISAQKVKELKLKIKYQKKLIKAHVTTIKILQDRHEIIYAEQFSMHEETYTEQFTNMDEELIDIGAETIVEEMPAGSSPVSSIIGNTNDAAFAVDEEIPRGLSPGSTISGYTEDSTSPIEVVQISDNNDSSSAFRDGRGLTTEFIIPRTQLHGESEASSPLNTPSFSQLLRRPLDDIIPKSASISSEVIELPNPAAAPVCSFGSTSSNAEQHHYLAVRSSSSLLFLDLNTETCAKTGYVNEIRTTAKIYPTFPENIISQAQAIRLGLNVVLHDDDDHVKEVDFGRGARQKTKGIASLLWSSGVSNRGDNRGFPVPCYVCDNVPQSSILIFGESFLNRRNSYLASGRFKPSSDEKDMNIGRDWG